MILNIVFLSIGFVLLYYGANYLIDGSSSLAKKMKIPELIIGLTIVSFGTSAPEFIVGLIAASKGAGDITMGNVIGSNIFNLLFVLGLTGVILPIKVNIKNLERFIPFSIFVLLLVMIMGNDKLIFHQDNFISRIDGIILLIFFVFYIMYNIRMSKNTVYIEMPGREYSVPFAIFSLLLGLVMLSYGGNLVTNNAVTIARKMHLSEKLIAITIIAIGTSLPELITSLVAVIKKKPDIAVGNIVGSNIFNVLLVIGVSSVIRPFVFNIDLSIDIIFLMIASLVLIALVLMDKKRYLNRFASSIMLLMFIGYWIFVIYRG